LQNAVLFSQDWKGGVLMDKIKSFFVKYKRSLIVAAVVLLLASGVVYYKATAWERDLEITFTKTVYKPQGSYNVEYELFEIKNNTNHSLKDVYAVIEVKDRILGGASWGYGDKIASSILPGETVEYRQYRSQLNKEAKKQNEVLISPDIIIKRIKYKKAN
jgi:hypothetical protein